MPLSKAPRIHLDAEKYRLEAGMTKLELSDMTGIPRTTLRSLLRNPAQLTFDQAHRIARALNAPASAYEVIWE